MKTVKCIMLGMLLTGVLLTSAQPVNVTGATRAERWQEMVESAESSTKAFEQSAKFAAAADYLKLALALGLGMLIGRMGAISHRELTELKAAIARLAKSTRPLNPATDL